MNLVHTVAENPLAQALGWTLLHSLWQGAMAAAALAAVLVAVQSPRVRYAGACVAILAMAVAFGVTLVHIAQAGRDGLGPASEVVFVGWNLAPGTGAASLLHPGLAALVPWLAPLWLAGVWFFALRYVAGWIAVSRMR